MSTRPPVPHPLLVLDTLRGGSHLLNVIRAEIGRVANEQAVYLDVRGPAGVGREAILDEIQRLASVQLSTPALRCRLRTAGSYDLIRRLVELADPGEPGASRRAGVKEFDWLLEDRLRALAAARPVVVIVDNFHYAVPTAQWALRGVITEVADEAPHGLLLAVSSQGEKAGALIPAPTTLLEVPPLSATDVEAVTREVCPFLDVALIGDVVAKVSGNAFQLRRLLGDLTRRREDDPATIIAQFSWEPAIADVYERLSEQARCVADAVAVFSQHGGLTADEIGRICRLSAADVVRAVDEAWTAAGDDVATRENGRYTLKDHLARLEILRSVKPRAPELLARAIEVTDDHLRRAQYVRRLDPGRVADETEFLLRGAELAHDSAERLAMLRQASARANSDEWRARAAVRLAEVLLADTDDPVGALSTLAAAESIGPGHDGGLLFAKREVLKARAQARVRTYADAAAGLRRARESLAHEPEAQRAVLIEEAGKDWLAPDEVMAVTRAFMAMSLPEIGSTAADAVLLLAAARHVATCGGPAVQGEPAANDGRTVRQLVERAITGGGIWSAGRVSGYAEVCEAQSLLIAVDAYDLLVEFEHSAAAHLEHTHRVAFALHKMLVAQRQLLAGDLEASADAVERWVEYIPSDRRSLGIGILVYSYCEQGDFTKAEQVLQRYAAEEVSISESGHVGSQHAMARARVDQENIRLERAIRTLAEVGERRRRNQRLDPTFGWRTELIQLLERFAYRDHPHGDRWLSACDSVIEHRTADQDATTALLAQEQIAVERWGSPGPLARFHLAAGAWRAARGEFHEAHEHRMTAVELTKPRAIGRNPMGLAHAIALCELARSYRQEARADERRSSKSGRSGGGSQQEARQAACRFARDAADLAMEFGAAQLWLRACDIFRSAGHKTREFLPETARDVPMSLAQPAAVRWNELTASGLPRATIRRVEHISGADQASRAIRQILKAQSLAIPSVGLPRQAGRVADLREYRYYAAARFYEVRERVRSRGP